MNFFEHQERARRQTRRMLFLFALAVIGVVVVSDAVIFFAISLDSGCLELQRHKPSLLLIYLSENYGVASFVSNNIISLV